MASKTTKNDSVKWNDLSTKEKVEMVRLDMRDGLLAEILENDSEVTPGTVCEIYTTAYFSAVRLLDGELAKSVVESAKDGEQEKLFEV